jgi:hypothetical protein
LRHTFVYAPGSSGLAVLLVLKHRINNVKAIDSA